MHLIYRLCRNISYIVLGGDAAGVSLMIACYKRLALTTGGKPLHPVEDAASMVNRYAIVASQLFHLVCDRSIASANAVIGQTGPKVGSFDAGFGASYLARIVGQKKAREIWFMCRQYSAAEAERMGMVNKVVPLERLEDECVEWAETMMERSPLALRMIKAGLTAELDGQAGIQRLAGDCTMLY